MHFVLILVALLLANPVRAAEITVRDGNTVGLADMTYRLDGIDAPEFDQMCIDHKADPWACGVETRDQLTKVVGNRAVHCEDKGPDPTIKKRRLGVCTIDGESQSINQWLVRQGLALNSDSDARGRFGADEADAKGHQRGLWRGCFISPRDFRQWKTTGALLGASCRNDKDAELRAILFPSDPSMPPGCTIKARFAVRAKVTGNVGIYQMQGCRSYAALTKPNRWFCSEEDARAAGFRKAYNCGNTRRR